MKFLPLLWSNLKRKKVRTAFTLLSILVAFVLFGYLGAIRLAFSFGVDLAGADRLVTTHKTSIIMPLPVRYKEQIAQIPGVKLVTHATWFGGIYQDTNRNFQGIFQSPVVPAEYMAMYPEFKLPKAQMDAWLADRQGVVVGRRTAERYGWKVGDRVPIQATLWRKKDGSRIWEFNVAGIYDGAEKGTDTTQFLFRYDYFDEARFFGQGIVGWYILKIDDPQQAPQIAKRIDETFANSEFETKTTTEKALAQSFAQQVGDIGAIITAILTAVFVTMLLVAGNTMAQAVRERTAELAVLKTLGFTNVGVLVLVLAESCLMAVVGGGLGLAAAWLLVARGDPTGGFLPIFYLPGEQLVIGAALVVGLGFVAGILPAWGAMRLRIVDALRRL
jgi:putative ABC transport system permease protein